MPRRAGVLVMLLLGAEARADYKDSFKKGMDAFDRKRWEEVVRHMRDAASENPNEGERIKLYGLRFEAYFPHFYMGYAFVQMGKCPEALKALQTSQSQGAIRNTPRYAELLDGLKSCEAAAAPPSPSPTAKPAGPDPAALTRALHDADAAIAEAEGLARSVSQLAEEKGLSGEAKLGRAETEVKQTLASARSKLETGRRNSDLTLIGEAKDLGGQAKDGLAKLASLIQSSQPPLPPTLRPVPTQTAPATAAAPAPDLMAGAQAYFSGRYEDSIRLLDRAAGLSGRSAAQVSLLRAAARFALYRAGGEANAGLRRQAAEDVAACRRADPALAPDATAFSPQFAEFFRSNH